MLCDINKGSWKSFGRGYVFSVESNILVFLWSLNEASPKRNIRVIALTLFCKMLILICL